MRFTLSLLASVLICAVSCKTLDSGETKKPQITRDMPMEEAYQDAVQWGADTLSQVKELARERQQMETLRTLSEHDLLHKAENLSPSALLNVAHLYRVSSSKLNPKVVSSLLSSREPSVRQVGWRLAATKPSAEVARTIDSILEAALSQEREDDILMPDMARAIQENGLKSAYTFLVRGLMVQGSPDYASAMLALDPNKATGPFFDYLAKADLEDLRQLNQKSIDPYTCTVIFRFLTENPLPLNHPALGQLYLFAVSRNRALAEMAYAVLEKQIPENRQVLATLLARSPTQVQLAFIESSQQELSANVRLLLEDLKDMAQQKEVLEELNAPKAPVVR